ncbi:hypothetical protein [Loktanella sp. SALINAS62]|uniref:hypothetical protein n=1 Tax=Loktanella sp. SALINAS62 TaxID=2706124 RepID=UPI001B8D8165|nr:hypothetical protein [Loktanella sp. SALINAS62]MBS1302708.1 hypothetical protein [Loktanella sp. SALINAS62]
MAQPQLKQVDAASPELPLLTLIRMSALDCRVAARASATACATIDPTASSNVFAAQLVKILPQVLERRPVIWRPGTRGATFDEEWLLAVVDAVRRGDVDSERFLLRRRVKPASLHTVRLLVRGMAQENERPN